MGAACSPQVVLEAAVVAVNTLLLGQVEVVEVQMVAGAKEEEVKVEAHAVAA